MAVSPSGRRGRNGRARPGLARAGWSLIVLLLIVPAAVLVGQTAPLPAWTMFMLAAQFVAVRSRHEQEFTAAQYAMLLMAATWHSPHGAVAVFAATAAYEMFTGRETRKALFNIATQPISYLAALWVYLQITEHVEGPWGVALAVLLAGVAQDTTVSAALHFVAHVSNRDLWAESRWLLVSLPAAVVAVLLTLVWPPVLLVLVSAALSAPFIKASFDGMSA